ncbi:MAG: hypothetical protein HC802_10685 [Caldilineaceae bacterium]|nr:hypothetical protein [Caldilineaceae bacterium]
MPTTSQMLAEYPDLLLTVLAELRGAYLDAADNREQAVDLLAAQITDPTSVQMAYEEVTESHPESKAAIDMLLAESGEVVEAQFSRSYGSVRQMGPAKLERESPWLYPESISELLYYYGLIGRGFKGAGQSAHTIIYLPTDIEPWLPHPQKALPEGGLAIQPIPPPPAARAILTDESFLEDAGTFFGFLHTERLRLTSSGPHPEDIDRFVQRLQIPFDVDMPQLNTRLALILHLANRLGWLRRTEDGAVQLAGNRVRTFLALSRADQRRSLWDAWRESPEWNDLCRTPFLECTETGNWHNDPLQTRNSLLQFVAQLQPGLWYSQSDVTAAIKEAQPDFQRPTGNYDTWYIRDISTQEFLKGFEQWDAVEGALLRFLFSGPLHWLGALDLAEPSAGDDLQISLSQWGMHWLGENCPVPLEAPRDPAKIGDDYTINLAYGTPLSDRFRVERFASWQSSYPHYTYRINQRSLKRAADEGINAEQILGFLRTLARQIPENVSVALQRFEKGELAASTQLAESSADAN